MLTHVLHVLRFCVEARRWPQSYVGLSGGVDFTGDQPGIIGTTDPTAFRFCLHIEKDMFAVSRVSHDCR